MTRRTWGHDNEERSAVALKAQDAYALSRQGMERILKLETDLADTRGDLTACQEANARALDRIRLLLTRVEALEAAGMPPVVAVKRPLKERVHA